MVIKNMIVESSGIHYISMIVTVAMSKGIEFHKKYVCLHNALMVD